MLKEPETQREAAENVGLSKDQEVQAVRVANVPEEKFDEVVDQPGKPPSLKKIAEMGRQPIPENHVPPRTPDPAFTFIFTVERFREFLDKTNIKAVLRD